MEDRRFEQLYAEAATAVGQHRLSEAESLCEEALLLCDSSNQCSISLACSLLALIAQRQGKEVIAERRRKECVRNAPQDGRTAARYNHNLGLLALDRSELKLAEELFAKFVRISHSAECNELAAEGYQQLGVVAYAQGRDIDAEEYYTKAISSAGDVLTSPNVRESFRSLSSLYLNRGDYVASAEWANKALSIARENKCDSELAQSLNLIGMIEHRRGNYAAAESSYRQASEVDERVGDLGGRAKTLHNLGMALGKQKRFKEALRCLDAALEIKLTLDDPLVTAVTYSQLGAIYLECDRNDAAKESFLVCLEYCDSVPKWVSLRNNTATKLTLMTYCCGELTKLAKEEGDIAEAKKWAAMAMRHNNASSASNRSFYHDIMSLPRWMISLVRNLDGWHC